MTLYVAVYPIISLILSIHLLGYNELI